MARAAPPPIPDVVEEHLAEAGFLWAHRERALASPRHTIAEVAAGPEERLAAHLDGVGIAGADADEALLAPALAGDDAGLAAAATAVLAAAGRLDPIRAAIPGAQDGGRALAHALALSLGPGGAAPLVAWLGDGDPAVQAVAVRALAARRAAPAAEVRALLASGDPRVRAAALGAAPVLGEAARPALEAALADPDPTLRDAAIDAGLRLGLRAAWAACQRAADAGAATPLALEVLAASGDAADVERIAAAADVAALRRAALFAAGLSGTARGAEVCAAWLADPTSSRTAAEGLWAVTGIAVAGPYAAAEPAPHASLPELASEDLDAPALPGEDADLPCPHAERLAAAFRERRAGLRAGERYLLGRPWTPAEALAAVRDGPTRRRHALARELAIRTRGAWAVNPRAWARDQLRAQAAPLPAGGAPGLPFARLLRA